MQTTGRKFDASLVLGVAKRCSFGCPVVIVCSPVQIRGLKYFPFPTSFWLTCPWLVRHASQVESKGGVDECEQWIERNARRDWIPYNIFHQRLRLSLLPEPQLDFLRRFRPKLLARIRETGVGGMTFDAGGGQGEGVRVKCLHLQTASWLALHRHPGSAWLRAQGLDAECEGSMTIQCVKNRDATHCVSTAKKNLKGLVNMWKGRFEEDTAQVVQKFTQSLNLDWRLYKHDIQGSVAHVRMLEKTGLITEAEAAQIVGGLRTICAEIESGKFTPSEKLEDVHMNIESRLTELTGAVGAKLHAGRSRNDQVATTVRLYLRERLLNLRSSLLSLLCAFLDRAKKHRLVIVSGYTHLQQAQPISLGHYWMAWFEAFMRDYERLEFASRSLDECPLGGGALAGSTLPLDRDMTCRILGFDHPTRNSLDTVAQRDYMSDYHHFASLFAVHASRMAEDLIIYATQEFGWLKLPDSFCTGSSIMPQKKNPDVLELIRGKTGQVIGHTVDLLVMTKGLPMTYDRDLQEDKRGLFASLDTLDGILEVLPPLISKTEVDAQAARAALEKGLGLTLATDIAEYLVLKGVPFRDAHWKVGRVVHYCIENGKPLTSLSLEELSAHIPEAGADVTDILSLEKSVARRNTYGGTGFEQVALQIGKGEDTLKVKEAEFKAFASRIESIE
ncbi:hypothetical protein FACS1894204_05190 [Synergistales bacterium]|nr:hypothetical protein FACS1894204_05190 [Synergistales bacterium]